MIDRIQLIEKTSNDRVLSLEFVLPVVENADLLVGEAVEGGGDVVVVLAHLRQGSAGVFAGEHGVGAAGAVKGFSGGDVVDAALHRHVDRLRWVRAVVLAQLLGCQLHCLSQRVSFNTVDLT